MLGRRKFMAGMAVSSIGMLGAGGADGSGSRSGAAGREAAKALPQPDRAIAGALLSPCMLEDALVGSSYLGCGGGGSLTEARALIAADLAAGRRIHMLGVPALADTDRVACPYALASLAPLRGDIRARLDQMEGRLDTPTEAAFTLLADYLNTSFSAVILGEIGPLSMAEGLSIAARLGVPALDADTVGRATPEINQHSVRVAGHPLTPAAGVTPFGDEIILRAVKDPSREEDVFRALSATSGLVGVVDAPITGAVAKADNVLVTGSLSLAMRIGTAVRRARAAGEDAIDAGRQAGGGYRLFEGQIDDFTWRDEDGFLQGNLRIAGTGVNAGQRMELLYKNEHLVARRDGQVIATCPDLITVIDRQTHEGTNNPDFTRGQAVSVLGFRCHPLWRKPAGLAVFHPRYFGYDLDYIPIEDRL